MKPDYIIKLPPVTKKNSQRIWRRRDGTPFIAPSKKFEEYQEEAGWYLHPVPPEPIKGPVNVKVLFYMPNLRDADLTNLLESVDDIMVHYGILKNDCFKVLDNHDGSRCLLDRENPRTEIYIQPVKTADEMLRDLGWKRTEDGYKKGNAVTGFVYINPDGERIQVTKYDVAKFRFVPYGPTRYRAFTHAEFRAIGKLMEEMEEAKND